jgi:hypothetical protein
LPKLKPSSPIQFFLRALGYKSLKEKIIDWGYDAGIMFYPNKYAQIDFSIVDNVFNKTHYASLLEGYSYAISKN